MSINSIYRLAIEAEVAGQKFVNVLHYRQNSISLTEIGAEYLLTAAEETLIPAYALLVSSSISFRKMTVTEVAEGGESAERSLDVQGGVSGETYAFQVCPLLSWRTGIVGRSNRGRTYLFPPGEGVMGPGGTIALANKADYATLAATMMEFGIALAPNAFTLGIYSRKEALWNRVTSYVLRDYGATQRKRRPVQ